MQLKDLILEERREQNRITQQVSAEYVKPSVSEQEQADDIILKISERFSEELTTADIDELSEEITRVTLEECSNLEVSYETKERIKKTVLMTVIGNGPIEPLLKDPTVTEVVVQRFDNIVIERNGKIEKTPVAFSSEEHLQTIIRRIVQRVGRQINIINPIVDARLKDGSRINATIPPVSVDGATLTIRKFSNDFLSGDDYINIGSLSEPMLYFLEKCVEGKLSMFISGGTGSGKTTLLNMLSAFIPEDELIITIEDSCELKLQQPNVRRMEVRLATTDEMTSVDQTALVKAALRQRPDRIILGETRDGSIVDIITAMSTGHEGSMSTIHANSPRNMCDTRIPILYSMNKDTDFSEKSIIRQLAEAVQLIIQISRYPDGSRKISHITYIDGIDDTGRIILRDIFRYNLANSTFEFTGFIPEKVLRNFTNKKISFNKERVF